MIQDDDAVRFLAKVGNEDGNGCLNWLGCIARKSGYGQFRYKKTVTAHRFAFELAHGRPIQHGLHIDHICRNRRCVSPKHLREVTHLENVRAPGSMVGKNQPKKAYCLRGHFRIGNVSSNRACHTCKMDAQRKRRLHV